jgi:hypothetical protein
VGLIVSVDVSEGMLPFVHNVLAPTTDHDSYPLNEANVVFAFHDVCVRISCGETRERLRIQ